MQFKIMNLIKLSFLKNPKESQLLLGRWKLYDNELTRNINMSNANKDNCYYNHNKNDNITIEEIVIMSHNNSKPTQ